MTILDPLRRAAQVGATRPATTCGDIELTYAETWERCRRLIGALRKIGLQPGDRVGVVGPNSHQYLELYQAVPGAGFVLVPLNARLTTAELRYALEDSGTRVVFGAGDASDLGVDRVVNLGEDYETLLDSAEPADPPDALPRETVAGLFYTGGTTGRSKGVMLTHANLLANAMHLGQCWPFTPSTRWLVAAPMFHAAGTIAVLATVWNAGHHVVLPAFDPGHALDLIETYRVTSTLVVPTMLAALNEEQQRRPRDVSSLRFLSHGGSPCATETLRRAVVAFPNAQLLHVYGATETAPIATLLPNEERVLDTPRARSCGQSAVGVEVAVVDSAGRRQPAGVVGEIAVRGPNVMVGYWNKPAETDAALVDGWYRSGDLGYQDAEGFFFLVDRAKDMIVSGGENVYCTEVEEALYQHTAVLEAAVFGVPDSRWGEAVYAVVVQREAVDRDDLLQHCRALIADFKVPKHIELRAEPLPKSGAGKILKWELRDPHWSGHEERISGA